MLHNAYNCCTVQQHHHSFTSATKNVGSSRPIEHSCFNKFLNSYYIKKSLNYVAVATLNDKESNAYQCNGGTHFWSTH